MCFKERRTICFRWPSGGKGGVPILYELYDTPEEEGKSYWA